MSSRGLALRLCAESSAKLRLLPKAVLCLGWPLVGGSCESGILSWEPAFSYAVITTPLFLLGPSTTVLGTWGMGSGSWVGEGAFIAGAFTAWKLRSPWRRIALSCVFVSCTTLPSFL